LTPYPAAHDLQRELLRRRQEDTIPDTLLLLEHTPVVTLGRNAGAAGVLVADGVLAAAGIEIHRVERGGQATYHGPGQVVGYPILRLRDHRLGVRAYVNRLEEVMIRVAARFGIAAQRRPGRPGIYAGERKLGAIGVAVSRGVSYHGFAFNVSPDLSHYRFIVPCGDADTLPTSLASLRGATLATAPVVPVVERSFLEVFGAAAA
jgi:lipoate-protein ligase B